MPNHCHNDLWISGATEDVDALLTLMGADLPEPKFDFNAVLPYPKAYNDRDDEFAALGHKGVAEKYGPRAQDGYNSGGYEWCVENWGTKWNAYRVARRDYMGVCITFQTAWSPPRPVIAALHKKFPQLELSLEWFELGAAICGGVRYVLEEDFYPEDDATKWEAGVQAHEWKMEGYLGTRGG